MSLDIMEPVILKRIRTIGGFCIVPIALCDNVNYVRITDGTKIGVVDIPEGYTAAVKMVS